jgi:hypothetical protein
MSLGGSPSRVFWKFEGVACLRQRVAHLAEQDGYFASAQPWPSWDCGLRSWIRLTNGSSPIGGSKGVLANPVIVDPAKQSSHLAPSR